jgi:hypothetical protein
MPTTKKSHVKDGHAYFKNTGRYNEVTKKAIGTVENNAPSALGQKKLAVGGNKTAAAITTKKIWEALGR